MVAVPAATPVISPEAALIVATVVSDELQVPPADVEEKVVVSPTQIFCPPLSVPAIGAAVTVIALVAVSLGQPPVPRTVYVIVAVPAATPVISPEAALIVATVVFDELQVPPAAVDEKVVVNPTQIFCPPLRAPAAGGSVTITVLVVVALAQPPIPSTV
jgi:predicted RNA methylase